MIVIGLVGEKGSGKDKFAEFLVQIARGRCVVTAGFSDILYDTLSEWGISPTRVNLQKLPVAMDGAYGEGTLANAVALRLEKIYADVLVVRGMRWDPDVALIRRLPKNSIVYVTASASVRHARTLARGEKAGETETTFEQFMREEQAANEVGIPRIGASADYKIVNEGTLADYKSEVARVYSTIRARYS